jgi:hypothetical protein
LSEKLTDDEEIGIDGIHGAPAKASKVIPAEEQFPGGRSKNLGENWGYEKTCNANQHAGKYT